MGSFCAGNTQTQQQQQQTGTSTGTQQANTAGTTAQTSTPTYGGFVGSTLGGLGSSFAPGFSSIQAGGGSALPGVAPYIAQNSPFTQDVVKTTTDALNAQHARDLSGQMGAAAKAGTLTGSGTADIRRQSDNTFNTQTLAPTISNLNLAGYNSALGASTADQNRLLQSGSAFGSLAGTQAGLVPGLVNAGGGTNVGNTTGTTFGTSAGTTASTGNTTGQTTYNQSPLSNVLGGIGALGSLAPLLALSDERAKENIKEVGELKDGQKVYKYNLAGSPKTEIGLLAQEVEQRHPHAVDNPFGLKMVDYDKATKAAERPAHFGSGGRAEPASFHDKVGHAFSAFHKMRKEAEHGHKRHGFEDGGGVPFGNFNEPSPTGSEDGLVPDMGRSVGDPNGWGATVDRAPAAPKASWDNFNKSLSAWNKSAEMPKGFDSAPKPMAMDTRNPALEALAPLMQRRGYEGGGDVEPSYLGRGTDAPLPPGYDNPRGPDPARTLAAYGVERESPWGAFFRGLANTPTGNPSIPHNWASGIGNAAAERREEQRKQAQIIEQNAQLSGQLPTGGTTMAAQQLAETRRQHDKPTWGTVGQSEDGLPIYGWINPNFAPNFNARGSGAGTGAPGGTASAVAQPGATTPEGSPSVPGVISAPLFGQQQKDEATSGLTGEAFLKQLEEQGQKPRADMIRAISEGRERFPESPRTPQERALRRQAMQYDPTLNGQTYQVRAGVLKDTSSGPTSKNIAAINTAARHAADLYGAIDDLGTKDVPFGRVWREYIGNPLNKEADPKFAAKVNTFEAKKLALAEELSKAFHGGPSVSGVEEWKKTLQAADSPGALRATVAAAVKLLEGRNEELESNYFRAMNKYPDKPYLSPKAKGDYEVIKQAASQNLPLNEYKKQQAAKGAEKPNTDRLPDRAAAPAGATGQIPPQAIRDLQANPALAEAFREKYKVDPGQFLTGR